ncbi:hypothetical protein CsatA_001335 [Cannabis sativa]
MARTRSKSHGKPNSATKNSKKKANKITSDEIRGEELDRITEIEPLEVMDMEVLQEDDALTDMFQPPLSPNSSLETIKRQEEIRIDARNDFIHFLKANDRCNSNLQQGKNSISPILRSSSVKHNLENSFRETSQSNRVKITLDDIEEEILFWKPSIVCYVLGVNPPLHILEGFANRIWKEQADRVKVLSHGIFLIRFNSLDYRDQVINGGYNFFNRRPVIMKPWNPNVNFKKEDVKCVPIYIQLEDLELKYWGGNHFLR